MEAIRLAEQHLPALGLTVVKLCVWLMLLAVIFVPLERLFALRPQKVFRKVFVTDLGYYFLNGLVPALLLSVPLALVAWGARSLLPTSVSLTIAHWPLWASVCAAMIVGEVGFYWGHRWCHEVPMLWQFHAIHHSAEQVDWLVSTRAHPVDMVFTRLCGLAPLYALGLANPLGGTASLIPLLVLVVGSAWGFFIHANLRWRFGPLEWLVATPAFHHWHHTNDGPAYVNKNYAPMLPWIDRIFGTLYLPKDKRPARYGIEAPIPSNLFGQLSQPFMIWRPSVPLLGSPQSARRVPNAENVV